MTAQPHVSEFKEAAVRQLSLSPPQIAALLLLAIFERAVTWHQRPPDASIFLEPWFAHIVRYGPVQAFAHPFSNYEPAYLYLLAAGSLAHSLLEPLTIIKILSVVGTGYMFLALRELLKAAGAQPAYALILLVLPSVAVNDGLLAQCDALWVGSCIFGLAAMIRGRTLQAMVWCGIAIAFKAQAAFMAPVIVGAMIGRRAPVWQWLVPALVFVATLLPPMILGWPAIKLLTVYLNQANVDHIAGRLANPWMFGTVFNEDLARHYFFVGYVLSGLAALAIAALAARNAFNSKFLILLGALAGTGLPFLLPGMLERYYILGDVMTLGLAIAWKDPRTAFAVRAVQIASMLTHFSYIYFFYNPWPTLVGAFFAASGLIAMLVLAAPGFRDMLEGSKSPKIEAAGGRMAAR